MGKKLKDSDSRNDMLKKAGVTFNFAGDLVKVYNIINDEIEWRPIGGPFEWGIDG